MEDTMNGHIITARGFWNGSQRELFWCAVLPGLGAWASTSDRAIVYGDPADAEKDLVTARQQMRNDRLTVALSPAS
jgi:hypothetical protein